MLLRVPSLNQLPLPAMGKPTVVATQSPPRSLYGMLVTFQTKDTLLYISERHW